MMMMMIIIDMIIIIIIILTIIIIIMSSKYMGLFMAKHCACTGRNAVILGARLPYWILFLDRH